MTPVPISLVADANVLFGAATRALLISLDVDRLIRLRWSSEILAETTRALLRSGRQASAAHAIRNEERMRIALPQAMVEAQEIERWREAALPLVNSDKDAHVAACTLAVREGDHLSASNPVRLATRNLRDFRSGALALAGVTLCSADECLAALIQAEPLGVARTFAGLRNTFRSRPSVTALLEQLVGDRLELTASLLAAAFEAGEIEL